MILAYSTYHTLGSLSLSESEDIANCTLYEGQGRPGYFVGSGRGKLDYFLDSDGARVIERFSTVYRKCPPSGILS